MTKKGQNFGLPAIGSVNVAASLVRSKAVRDSEQATDDLSKEEDQAAVFEPTVPSEPMKPTVGDAPPETSVRPLAPVTELRRGGRPKGPPSRRMHLAIEEKMAKYLSRAWRTHERADGSLAMGPADLIEDLLAEHQLRSTR
jgi:hypothetical protein